MLKHVVIQEPVDYIKFDSGAIIQYNKLYHEINDMRKANFTEFNLNFLNEEALFNFIEDKLNKQAQHEVGYIDKSNDQYPRIYWNDNDQFIDDILDEIMIVQYKS